MRHAWLLLLSVVVILLPKYNLISLGEGLSHGLRIEDFFIFFLSLSILYRNKIRLKMFPGEQLYFVLYLFLFLSSWISLLLNGTLTGFLLTIRWVEYSAFYFILMSLDFNHKIALRGALLIIVVNLFFVIMQFYGYLPGIHSYGYTYDASTRPAGLTGGAWELPLVVTPLAFLLVFFERRYSYIVFYLLLAGATIIMTGTRTGMVAFIAGAFFLLLRKKMLIRFFPLMMILLVVIFSQERMEVPLMTGEIGLQQQIEIPFSLIHRLNTWTALLDQMGPNSIFFGLGFGTGGIYLDGLWVKLFAEIGIFGLLIVFVYITHLMLPYMFLLVPFLLTSFTLDALTSSKIMFSYYFVLVALKASERSRGSDFGGPRKTSLRSLN